MTVHQATPCHSIWGKRLISAMVVFCPSVMLAAIPQRRVKNEDSAETPRVEKVYLGAITQDISGFTLIELSIVLVIIGLLVGGVLVGRDLISAAQVRAQISQIEKYQQAVNTFKVKYNYLPGDIPEPYASQFGFAARGQYAGQGDGNGILEGNYANAGNTNAGFVVTVGETAMFWVDLSLAGLIDRSLSTASPTINPGGGLSKTILPRYMPTAIIGNENYVVAYSSNNSNYLHVAVQQGMNGSSQIISTPGLTVMQARAIDNKIDDAAPQNGIVQAFYLTTSTPRWSSGGGVYGTSDTSATAASPTTCFDNNNVGGATQQYSMTQNNGSGMNCALSFKFQ